MTNLNLKPLYKGDVYDYDDDMWYEEDLSDGEHLAVFMDLFKEMHETDKEDVISSKKEEMERIRKYLIAKLDAGLLGQHFEAKGEGLYCPDGIWELDSSYEFGESLKDLEDGVKALKRGDKMYYNPHGKRNDIAKELYEGFRPYNQRSSRNIYIARIEDDKATLERALKAGAISPEDMDEAKKGIKEADDAVLKLKEKELEDLKRALDACRKPDAIKRAKSRIAELEATMA